MIKKHNMYYLNHFEVYSSVVLNIVTLLNSTSPEHFHFVKLKRIQRTPISPSLPLLTATFCSVFVPLPSSDR